jgi:hypothetical protein
LYYIFLPRSYRLSGSLYTLTLKHILLVTTLYLYLSVPTRIVPLCLNNTLFPTPSTPEAELLDVFGTTVLKGPKLEILGSRVFTQIRPVWVGDLETRQKIQFYGFGLKIAVLYFLALSRTSLNNFKRYRRQREKVFSAMAVKK